MGKKARNTSCVCVIDGLGKERKKWKGNLAPVSEPYLTHQGRQKLVKSSIYIGLKFNTVIKFISVEFIYSISNRKILSKRPRSGSIKATNNNFVGYLLWTVL